MKDTALNQIRKHNGLTLLKAFPTRTEFVQACKLNPSQVGQLFGENASAPIGNTLARRIEKACGKPEFWMDSDHDSLLGEETSLTMEIMIDAVVSINNELKTMKIRPSDIAEDKYRELLRHVILSSITIGRVVQPQVQSALTLSGISKTTR